MKIEELIILQYHGRCSVVEAKDFKPEKRKEGPKIKIDIENGSWSYLSDLPRGIGEFNHYEYRVYAIGDGRLDVDVNRGVVGVYNRTNTEHLNRMIRKIDDLNASHSFDD